MGEFRLTTMYTLVFILFLITSPNLRATTLILGLLVYQVFAQLSHFGSTDSLTALNLSSIILLLTMFVAGSALRKEDNVTRFGLSFLFATLLTLGATIIVNSITVLDDIQFIRGLDHRRDVDNFNYIYVAEGFTTGSLVLLCFSKFKPGSLAFLTWSLFCTVTLWCAGSRASLLLFLVIVVTLHIAALTSRKISIKYFFAFVASLLLCFVSLVMISQPSVTVRFNPVNVTSDTSFLKRLEVASRLFSGDGEKHSDKNRTQYRSTYSYHVAPYVAPQASFNKSERGSLADPILSKIFGQYALGLKSKELYQHNLLSVYSYYGMPYFIAFLIQTAVLAMKIKTKDRTFPLFLYLCGTLMFRDDVSPLWWFLVGYIGVGFSPPHVPTRALLQNT